jgi:hypothetical protein
VEKIQDAILDAALLRPELIDPVSEKVRRRPSELVSELLKELDSDAARGPSFLVVPSKR